MKKPLKQIFYIITFLTFGYLFYKYIYDGTEHMVSTIDNNSYKVRRGPDKQLRANILAILNGKFTIIINR